MKFINLKPLTIARLKAYRRSIINKISPFEVCDCGSGDCDHAKDMNKDNPDYINLQIVRDRVNKELALRQTTERDSKINPADVMTNAEMDRLMHRKKKRIRR